MLTFRHTNVFFAAVLLAMLGLRAFIPVPLVAWLIIIVAYLSLLVYGSCSVQAGFYMPVVCAGNTGKKELALSFDDGPASGQTAGILNVLAAHQVPAAFFCIGKRIAGQEALLRSMHAAGHLIGNHSYSHHFWFDLFPSKKMLADLQHMDHALQQATGLRPRLFRPPYGVTNPNLASAVHKGNYIAVGWSVRSMDTVINNDEQLLSKTLAALHPGAVVLFHDTSSTTLRILPAFIRQAQEAGYAIVRLDKLLKLEPYV